MIKVKGRWKCTPGELEKRKGRLAWNKGLTKETDERMRKNAEAKIGNMVSEATKEKISKTLKGHLAGSKHPNWGRHWSKETREKMGPKKGVVPWNKGKFGALSANWKGGISSELYPAEFDRQLKELVRCRDDYRCQRCGCSEIENMKKLSVHHIDYKKKNCLPLNLISLCSGCNVAVNGNREFWEQYFSTELRERGF